MSIGQGLIDLEPKPKVMIQPRCGLVGLKGFKDPSVQVNVYYLISSTIYEMPIVLSSPLNKSHHITDGIISYRSTPITTHVIHMLMTPEGRSNKILYVYDPQTHMYGYP